MLPLALDAALADHAPEVFAAVEIILPNRTVRVMSGSGAKTFLVDGQAATFSGMDDVVGTLSTVSQIQEAIATEAPRLQINFMPPTTGGIADLASPLAQGSSVRVWAGAVDKDTGDVVGVAEIFTGFLDVVRELVTDNARFVEVDCASVLEWFFVVAEGARWIDSAQQDVWPGDDGLSYVASAGNFPMWGVEAALPPPPKTLFGKPVQDLFNLN